MKPSLAIFTTVKGARLPRAALERLAELILHGHQRRGRLNLIFVADAKMRRLNEKYRNLDRTTDVLSFNLEDEGDPFLGEIYISLPQARRNANQYEVSLREEILRLFCHGLLHLCGIHHPDKNAGRKVDKLVEDYLARFKSEARK